MRVYRVQFAASKTFIQPSYFQTKFKLEDEVEYFEKDGYYKYYVGEFETEAEAAAYYHATNDVGYVISAIIDKPIEVQVDTTHVGEIQLDTSRLDSTQVDTMQAIVPADSIVLDSDDNELEESIQTGSRSSEGGLTLGQVLLICLIGILFIILIVLVVRYMRRRNETTLDEMGKEGDKDEVEEEDQLLAGKEPFAFLDQSDKDISAWDQLRLHEKIKVMKKAPPEFSFWLDSDNSTIVAFCLRMIRSFKQTGAYNQVVRLLGHKNDEIRAEAIVTLGEIANKEVLDLLKEQFEQENYTNKMLILRAMARMPDDSSIDFLQDLLKNPGDFRIEAAHALASVESIGIEGVEEALKDMGTGSEIIARHILINKL